MAEPLKSLLKLLPTLMRLAGEGEEVREQAVFAVWRVLIGPQLRASCIPIRLVQKHLLVAVPDQAWKTQMEAMSGEFLFRLNSLLGAPFVTFIEFQINHALVTQTRAQALQPVEFHETEQLTAELRADAEAIKNPALREQFLRTAAKALERKQQL